MWCMQFYASSSSALASEDSTAMFGVLLREAFLIHIIWFVGKEVRDWHMDHKLQL